MTLRLWIIGLALALCVYTAITIGIIYALISRHHLSATGWIVLASNGYVGWITFHYLRQRIRERRNS